jgi:hypothetical protein
VFTLEVKTDELDRKFDLAVGRVHDLDRPLRKFGSHLRKKALAKYKAQNFAPLAESTIRARAEKGLHSLERKLAGDVRKALKREKGQEPIPRGLVGRLLQTVAAEPPPIIAGGTSRGVQNRQSVLQAFQERHGFRHDRRSNKSILALTGAKALTEKQSSALDKRTERAVQAAVNKPILGGLPGTLEVQVSMGTVTLRSHTQKPWTEIHNAGGSAGKGARISKRETIKLDESDLTVLTDLLKEYLIEPLT